MGRNSDNAPVSHTFPMIDGMLDAIHSLYRSSEEMSKGELDYLEKTLEKIRSHNGALRDWGNELYKEKEELENEVDELKEKINRLEYEIDDYKKETPADKKQVLAAGLSDLKRAEATVEFMNIFRQMLNEARFFSHDERSLRGYLIEDIERKKLKAEEFLKTCR